MARPKKEIDKELFEKLCSLQCTEAEICSTLDVTDKTLNAWCKKTYKKGFSEVFKLKRLPGLVSLRRSQFAMAKTHPAMGIWLGKNLLGQKDKIEEHVTHEIEPDALTISIEQGLKAVAEKMEKSNNDAE